MDVYLPIAGQSVNAPLIILLGFMVGVLSGMFGVGGGFLTTPLLIFYGIPPTVAVASAATQITGASVSGVMVHMRRGGVDLKMALVMITGGLFGSVFGAVLFRLFQASGQIDLVIDSLYVIILGGIGGLMLKDALVALGYLGTSSTPPSAVADGEVGGDPPATDQPRNTRWVQRLPMRWRFAESGLFISPVAPLTLGFVAGVLTVFLGIGGGFILVPAMIYLLGMPARVVIGTSLAMVLAVSAATTMVHSLTTRAVDIVLAGLLLIGGVVGAQYGALLALRIKPDFLRLALAVIILIVALRMALGLAWRPDEIFSIEYL
ncbi:MAG: sulfite exporter TauE/SafE family protein [Sphingomicrobium sp.]